MKKLLIFLFVLFYFLFSNEIVSEKGINNINEVREIKKKSLTQEEIDNILIEKKINETLKTRKAMLLAHQILGWATVGLLSINTFITSPELVSAENHQIIGIAGGISYFTTAGISIFTPTLHTGFILGGDKENTNKFIHKILAFIHIPAMLTTIVLGFIIHERNKGNVKINNKNYLTLKTTHTISSYVLVSSLALSLMVIYFDF